MPDDTKLFVDFDRKNPTDINRRLCQKNANSKSSTQRISLLSENSFLTGAIKELYDVSYLIVKKSSKNLLNDLFGCLTIQDAQSKAEKFVNSLVIVDEGENVYNNSSVKSFLSDAPIFKLLFVENSKNQIFQKIQNAIYSNCSREQRIVYTVMNMSYFDNIKTAESALKNINEELTAGGFDILNDENDFDSLIISSIYEENRVNIDNNLNLNVGGIIGLSNKIDAYDLSLQKK